ncbi:hypothetical protein LDENG_00071250 [Lucifuga dentata]|nr:hypothetical protein LDENG_00071250 [Lucifuga dentata]
MYLSCDHVAIVINPNLHICSDFHRQPPIIQICLWIKDFLSDCSQRVRVGPHINSIIKFTDDTTVVGFISGGDESAYQDEVERLSVWCTDNNLVLNTSKTKELIIDYRRNKMDIQPLFIGGECVERVLDF